MHAHPPPPPVDGSFQGALDGVNWKRYLVIALTALVVLTSGIIIGSGLTILYFGRTLFQQASSPEQATRLIVGKLRDSVSLTPEEQRRTEDLVERHMADAAAIRWKYENEMRRKFGDMSSGLTGIIGPERMRMCGGWMRHHNAASPGPENDPGEKKKNCRCGKGECGAD